MGMGICCFLVEGFSRVKANVAPGHKCSPGSAVTFFVYFFTAVFGATWLTVPWLYPAEIFSLEICAKGNAWGVVGWSTSNGWLVRYFNPILRIFSCNQSYLLNINNLTSCIRAPWREDSLHLRGM